MIESLTVWHGPVYEMYARDASNHFGDDSVTHINCRESSPKDLSMLLPEVTILADDINNVWFHELHEWKADEQKAAITYMKKNALNFAVVVTTDTKPLKGVADLADSIHSHQVPSGDKRAFNSDKKAYATSIEQWLMDRAVGLEKGVAQKLVEYCAPEPAVAQRVAVTIASSPTGVAYSWEDIRPIVEDLVSDKKPIWELGEAIASGSCEKTLSALKVTDLKEPFLVLRYLENRYRMLLVATSKTASKTMSEVFPSTNPWVVKNVISEARGLTPEMCAKALSDIGQANDVVLYSGGVHERTIAIENCAIKLTARHEMTSR